uniref:PHD-type zinc finger plants domain-containing protein n=1 Tax=Rhizophora mucronata TaxID=61149 RepID=A0A2P2J8H2_RHIMU
MVDLQTVCCMCGDVGFPDKLFRCNKCDHRFQHSYCSSYYSEFSEPIELCDWCRSEERNNARHGNSSKKSVAAGQDIGVTSRSEYSGDKIKQNDHHHHHRDDSGGSATEKGNKNPSGVPSPRPTTRRYKLLKDVMC